MPITPLDLLSPMSPLPRLRTIADRRKVLDLYINTFNGRVTELAAQLHGGQIGVDAWQLAMREEIKALHTNALVISYGGEWNAVPFTEWGRLGGNLRIQYQYLNRYAQQVQSSALNALSGGKFYSEKYLEWRSRLYGGNARASFYRGLAQGLLPQVPGDGQTQCGSNCKCELVFEEGEEPGLLLVYWVIDPGAENCPDCQILASEWAPYELWLPVGLSARDWVTWLSRMEVAPIVA